MIAAGLDPISQFDLHTLAELKVGKFDISFTNSALMMVVTVACVLVWLLLSTGKRSLVPGRAQSVAEVSYEFVANMIRSTAGKDGLRFFPFVFTLFIFILFGNLLGMIPFFFTITSHVIVTVVLALMVWFLVIGYGIYKNGFGFLKLFWPSGVPFILKALLVMPIEIVSFISRPISHSIRLWANMFAGHILLKLFAGFAVAMFAASGIMTTLGAVVPYALVLALVPLEFLVAFVQAYVFALLTCVYLSDALHPGH
ncbi:F0F1 ATP synthase subunit A [Litorimonas sp. RW-G-Af-16]|uniref:F0F1 ATP synthase subunit A n=1 Tax=Litorimonas sp. RW-G-Af-16 TaxID=3241168 RepID=UPI00390CCC86